LAASIAKRFNQQAEIKPGRTGQFDVIADGSLIYSKAQTGRFPVEGEVEDALARIIPA
jgi:selT/selW/selH-like putative selenoprotein